MILADKIIALRKKNGWSQEELAEKLNVTRQSVSKWEGAQSVPDLDRVLQMSQIFGVSTDYLLKEELEEEQYAESTESNDGTMARRVTMEEANTFLKMKENAAPKIALGVSLCILAPVTLFLLDALAISGKGTLSVDVAGGMGLIVLILCVAVAVALFIFSGAKSKEYAFLETEVFETEYGVTGMVKERQKQFADKYTRCNVLGVCLCILAAIPLFMTNLIQENELTDALAISALLIFVATGVNLFVRVGIPQASMQKLLQEGEFTKTNKRKQKKCGWIATVYWLIVVAIFLGYSFATDDWGRSWIIWPVAGILYAALWAVVSSIVKD